MKVTYRPVKAVLEVEDYVRFISIKPPEPISFKRISLSTDGELVIRMEYPWDHASGAFDTDTIIEGALVHDAICELIHNRLLPESYWNEGADVMYDININSKPKMWKLRAKWVRRGIILAGPDVTESRRYKTIGSDSE